MRKYIAILLPFCFLCMATYGQSGEKVNLFPLHEVELLPGPFREARQVDMEYILAMKPDRLLAPYLREAGLTPKAPSYTNWENSGLDGHIGGHYLSALAMMYASTGDAEIKGRLDYMIDELKRCQDASGTGFIGGTPGSAALWEEIKNGDIRAGGFNLNGKWVPLYNLHKTYAGLRDAWLFAANAAAAEILVKLTDWMADITSGLTDEQMQDMLRSEHGGLNEVFADVAEITGESKYLNLARRFSHLFILEPLLRKEDKLTGLHANTQIPKVIGYKRIADLEGNAGWDAAVRFFWQAVTKDRTVSIGGNSVREHFHPADNFEPMISDIEGPETCNTYNMMRLSGMLFRTTAGTEYLDYYERALYNHILASQEPQKGGFVYFTPMRPGHYRVYSQPETSMWCCVGSGLENHAKYGELIYAHTGEALHVNLFIPSRVSWKEKGVALRQETLFPDENTVSLELEKAGGKRFALKIRIPEWTKDGKITVSVNGKELPDYTVDGSFISIDRKWKKGDKVELSLPMKVRMEQIPDGRNYSSFAYGPIVLAAATGTNDLTGLYADDSRGGHIAHGRQVPLLEAPTLVSTPDAIAGRIEKENTPALQFRYNGDVYPARHGSLTLTPFFRTHNTRYAIYFQHVTPENLESMKQELKEREKVAAELEARTADVVYCGEQQPESDHRIQYEDSQTGNRDNRHFRSAKSFFSYEMKVKDAAASLLIVLNKTDRPAATTIRVDGVELTGTPGRNDMDEHFTAYVYTLPGVLKEGTYTVRFTPEEGESTARIYEVRLMK